MTKKETQRSRLIRQHRENAYAQGKFEGKKEGKEEAQNEQRLAELKIRMDAVRCISQMTDSVARAMAAFCAEGGVNR